MSKLNTLALQITEEEYKALPHISYSKIARFLKEGPESLNAEYKPKKTSAMLYGSVFDTLLTDPDSFDKKYKVLKNYKLNVKVKEILVSLYNQNKLPNFTDNSEEVLLKTFDECDFWCKLTYEVRLKKLTTNPEVTEYYNMLLEEDNRTEVSVDLIETIKEKIKILKNHEFTKDCFNTKDYEIIYQAKFASDNLNAKCMFDILLVDHKLKKIAPIDLKIVEDKAKSFLRSFYKFKYYLQAELYTDVLQDVLDTNKWNYEILPFSFLVLSQQDNAPLIFNLEINKQFNTDYQTDMVYVNNTPYISWKTLYKDIRWHYTHEVFDYSKQDYENYGMINIPTLTKTNTNYLLTDPNDQFLY